MAHKRLSFKTTHGREIAFLGYTGDALEAAARLAPIVGSNTKKKILHIYDKNFSLYLGRWVQGSGFEKAGVGKP